MSIYNIPMLFSGILCTLLFTITWLFRRRENINRVFSFFTLALAIDCFVYFAWFQFGDIEHIDIWLRATFTVGFIVPIGLILFFFAFTGYDKKKDEKILGIKVRHFQTSTFILLVFCIVSAATTELIFKIPEAPKDVWDFELGPFIPLLYLLFAGIFFYLSIMVLRSYRATNNKPQKRFITILALGTGVWILIGYLELLLPSLTIEDTTAINYLGTAIMVVIYFVAILNYQSDKVHELNVNLERKVENRTQQLKLNNSELEETLYQLKQMQKQIIVQEKMATLGQLVAGLTHDINTPISAIRSMNDTKAKAAIKLQAVLENNATDLVGKEAEMKKVMGVISKADKLIEQGTDRLSEIINNLKNFARLNEDETAEMNIHEGLDSVLALISHDLLTNIEVVREYSEIPPLICHPRKLNQVFLNIIKNACQAIEDRGKITITTSLKEDMVNVAISDTGKGISQDNLESIFDPGFTSRSSVVRASLGLSICYQIIKEHHGSIQVDSQLGKGSVFTLILPLKV